MYRLVVLIFDLRASRGRAVHGDGLGVFAAGLNLATFIVTPEPGGMLIPRSVIAVSDIHAVITVIVETIDGAAGQRTRIRARGKSADVLEIDFDVESHAV